MFTSSAKPPKKKTKKVVDAESGLCKDAAMENKYTAAGKDFATFTAAVCHGKAHNSEVFEIATGLRRWAPLPPVKKARIRHMLVMENGETRELGKVRR